MKRSLWIGFSFLVLVALRHKAPIKSGLSLSRTVSNNKRLRVGMLEFGNTSFQCQWVIGLGSISGRGT